MAQINPEILRCDECDVLAPISEFNPIARLVGYNRVKQAERFKIVYACPYCQTQEHVEHDKETFLQVIADHNFQ